MNQTFKLLDVVVLMVEHPEYHLGRGQVGTIVEYLDPGFYEVDFSDEEGQSYASLGLPAEEMALLRYQPVLAEQVAA